MLRIMLRILLALVLLGAGVGAGYGYGKHLMSEQAKVYEDKLKDMNKKIAAVQKRYTDERDQRSAAETQKRAALAEVEKLKQAGGQVVEVAKTLEAKAKELEAKNAELTQGLTQAKGAYAAMESKAAEIAAVARDRGEEIKKLNGEKQSLDSTLKGTEAKLDHCESNNARLAILGTELAEKYEKKGLVTSIFQNEPFTQVKKVEIENLAAEYREQINKEKLKKEKDKKQAASQPQKAQ
ncbi:MAG: hypothetical protein AB9873_12550 [Syntrophobacteraceae bacterium]